MIDRTAHLDHLPLDEGAPDRLAVRRRRDLGARLESLAAQAATTTPREAESPTPAAPDDDQPAQAGEEHNDG